jgi:hypothetical protein
MQYDGLAAGRELKRCKSLFEELVELLLCSFNLSLPTPRFEKRWKWLEKGQPEQRLLDRVTSFPSNPKTPGKFGFGLWNVSKECI